jgi:hypothetical protein
MRLPVVVTAFSFGALAIRGLAPVRAWGGWGTLLFLEALALGICLIHAWRFRKETSSSNLRDPFVWVLLAHFPLFAGFYFVNGAEHGPDAIDHLEYLRSLVFDHDLDLQNDDAIFFGSAEENPAGDPAEVNLHGVGPAILWAPAYLVAHALCPTIGQVCNGASRPYVAAATLTSIFFGTLGLICAYRLARAFATRGAAVVATLGLTWGTFLFWYLTFQPTMSHSLSFATAALVFLMIRNHPATAKSWFAAGVAVGVSSLMRWSNAILGGAAFPTLLIEARAGNWRVFGRNSGAFALGALIGFAPQMLAWQVMFGVPLLAPQGSSFFSPVTLGDSVSPVVLDVLFSPNNGLFTWSPLLYLAVPGLLAVRRLGLRMWAGFWIAILLLLVANSRVADWWGGPSFGGRRFCTILAVLTVGLAISLDHLIGFARSRPLFFPAALVAVAAVWNLLLAEGARQGAWKRGNAVTFSQMARVAADEVSRAVGSPLALPGSVVNRLLSGRPVKDYEAAIFRRPYSTFVLRFGEGDLPFLGGGFSIARGSGDALHRSTRDGLLLVPLQGAADYTLGLRAGGWAGEAVTLEVNGITVASCPLQRIAQDCEREVPAARLRPGPNAVRLRLEPATAPGDHEVDLVSISLRPRRSN